MIVIDYKKFLSIRFDLVLRWYFLEKVGFDAQKASDLVGAKQYEYLRYMFARMKPVIDRDAEDWGIYFFRPIGNWLGIEDRMRKEENWIREHPYVVRIGGMGASTKRFILALKYKRTLYWQFDKRENMKSIWGEDYYRKFLNSERYSTFKNTKKEMVDRMEELDFFSVDTYVGNMKLLGKYLAKGKSVPRKL